MTSEPSSAAKRIRADTNIGDVMTSKEEPISVKTAILMICSGVLLSLLGLWGGAYGMENAESWMKFPSFATGFMIFFGGMAIIGVAIGRKWGPK